MLSDIEIAHQATLRPAREIGEDLGLLPDEIEPNGRHKAKVSLRVLDRLAGRPDGKYVLVTAITPTPLGEGKTLTTVGLGQALRAAGHTAFSCIRQPSLGPVFGIIKSVMGFRQFLLRGLAKASLEWTLVALAYNFKRLFRLIQKRGRPAAGLAPAMGI